MLFFWLVSDSVSKKISIKKSIEFGIGNYLVSKKVSDSVSEIFGIGKKIRIRFRSDFGYRHTLHPPSSRPSKIPTLPFLKSRVQLKVQIGVKSWSNNCRELAQKLFCRKKGKYDFKQKCFECFFCRSVPLSWHLTSGSSDAVIGIFLSLGISIFLS